MKCPNCAAENKWERKTCKYCGTDLVPFKNKNDDYQSENNETFNNSKGNNVNEDESVDDINGFLKKNTGCITYVLMILHFILALAMLSGSSIVPGIGFISSLISLKLQKKKTKTGSDFLIVISMILLFVSAILLFIQKELHQF